MADIYTKKLFRRGSPASPLCLRLFHSEVSNQAEHFSSSVTIICLKHMTETKAHYLVNGFLIRDVKVSLKKAKLEKSYLGEKNELDQRSTFIRVTICFDLEESKAVSNKYTVYLLSLSPQWRRQTEHNEKRNGLSTLLHSFNWNHTEGVEWGKR